MNDQSRRDKLIERAIACLAAEPGVSMDRLAELMDLGRATLYRHFESRELLLRAVALESVRQTSEAIDSVAREIPDDGIRALVEVLVPLGDRFHFLMSEGSMYSDPDVIAAQNEQGMRLAGLVETWKTTGHIGSDVSTSWATYAIDAIVWAAWQSVQDGYVARRDATELAHRTLTRGLGPS